MGVRCEPTLYPYLLEVTGILKECCQGRLVRGVRMRVLMRQ